MFRTIRRSFGMSLALFGALLFVGSALPLSASAAASASATPTLKVAQNSKLGSFLSDGQGMSLYTYKKDKPGESACLNGCAKNWPPLTISEGMQPAAGPGISGKLGQIERKDGSYQVTYNGMPLYRYIGDSKPGDMNGQGLGGMWYVVSPATATATTSGASSKGW